MTSIREIYIPCSMTSIREVLSRATFATRGAWTLRNFNRPSSILSNRPQCFCSNCFRAVAKESWDLFSLSLIWLEMFLASLSKPMFHWIQVLLI
jgi:hypothetical protein